MEYNQYIKMMNKYKTRLSIIASIIATVAGTVTVLSYFQIKPFNEKEITSENVVYKLLALTNKSDSLSVEYKGKSIDNLWKLRFSIRNTGKKSLIGIGDPSDIYNNCMRFNLDKDYEVISYNIVVNDFSDSLFYHQNTFSCYFRKWKIGEKLQLDIWVHSPSASNPPHLLLDERSVTNPIIEIKNKEISELETSDNNLDWLVNLKIKYPKVLFKIAKYTGIFFAGLFAIMPLYGLFFVPYTNFKYGRWKRKKMRIFIKELSQTDIDPTKKDYYKRHPYEIPSDLRHKFSSIPESPFNVIAIVYMFAFFGSIGLAGILFFLFAWYNL